MKTPLQIELDGVKSSDYLSELIGHNLAKIEKRFGRAIACRVVVRAPNAHHQSGTPFEVSIRMALPTKKDIIVNHTPGGDRLTDLTAAINAAFKRALRRLDNESQQMQGRVKNRSASLG